MLFSGTASAISRRSPVWPQTARTRIKLAICIYLVPLALCAQAPPQPDLRQIARNPFADVIQLPVGPDIYFDAGPYNRTAADLQLQPLFPIQISKEWLLVPRIVATAVTYVPNLAQKSGGQVGLGDIVPTFFFTPAQASRIVWGVGPALQIPTATDSQLGAGRWGLGPSFVVQLQPEWGTIAILAQNIWSLPSATKRGPVNQMQLEPLLSYNLADEWYLITNPTITADWTQVRSNIWLLPIGGGFGRTWKLGRQPVDANLTIYRNVVRPANQLSPRWQLSLQVTLLFTKHR
jgi:hypothetical protein